MVKMLSPKATWGVVLTSGVAYYEFEMQLDSPWSCFYSTLGFVFHLCSFPSLFPSSLLS